jgi:hypothetical protein
MFMSVVFTGTGNNNENNERNEKTIRRIENK